MPQDIKFLNDDTDASDTYHLVTKTRPIRSILPSTAYQLCRASNDNRYEYHVRPPTRSDLRDSLPLFNLPQRVYQQAFYSRDVDIPDRTKEYAGLTYRLKGGQGIAHLEEWTSSPISDPSMCIASTALDPSGVGGWEYAHCPPSRKQVQQFRDKEFSKSRSKTRFRSQVNPLHPSYIYINPRISSYLIRALYRSKDLLQSIPMDLKRRP